MLIEHNVKRREFLKTFQLYSHFLPNNSWELNPTFTVIKLELIFSSIQTIKNIENIENKLKIVFDYNLGEIKLN